MGGKYQDMNKGGNIAEHPAAGEGQAVIEENEELHRQLAKDIRPRGLRPAVGKVYDRIAPLLSAQGRLKRHFMDVVVEYCELKSRIDQMRSTLDEEGWTYKPGGGRNGLQLKNRPEVATLNDDWRKWNSLVAQLGLSPGTELRFNDRQGDLFKDPDNEFSRI